MHKGYRWLLVHEVIMFKVKKVRNTDTYEIKGSHWQVYCVLSFINMIWNLKTVYRWGFKRQETETINKVLCHRVGNPNNPLTLIVKLLFVVWDIVVVSNHEVSSLTLGKGFLKSDSFHTIVTVTRTREPFPRNRFFCSCRVVMMYYFTLPLSVIRPARIFDKDSKIWQVVHFPV